MNIYLNGNDWRLTGYVKNQWRLTRSMETGSTLPSALPAIPATVPGAVQADLMKAGMLDDPNVGLDSMKGEWVNNREWIYEKEFSLPENLKAEKLILCFDGLDYNGEIYLNRIRIGEFSGMFIPVEIDITGIVDTKGNNLLEVVFYQSPEVDGQFGFSNRIRHLKSRFNYVWDWCPRIIPAGIWEDVYIKVYNYVRIIDFFPRAKVEDDGVCKIGVDTEIEAAVSGEYAISYRVTYHGREVLNMMDTVKLLASKQKLHFDLKMEHVEKWWPNGHGEQPLYQIELTIQGENDVLCDRSSKRIGFRNVKFVQNEGAAEGALPYTLVLNGKRVFIKGVNWVPISPFYGSVTKEQYRSYLQRFKDMNCNILRVWGGAILEKQAFYDLCDEMGLMVWQEFPQSSSGINNTPPDDHEFLKELEKVAAVFVKRRRHHASHIIWCGGNELMWEEFRPVDESHSNIKMLKELVEKLDAGKCFLPASASGPRFCANKDEFGKGVHHDVHGPWTYLGEAEQYSFFNGDDSLFRSETGCPGISRMRTLEKYQGNCSLWPPDASNPYWVHRGAWWIQLKELSKLFGEWDEKGGDIKEYVKVSRFLQAEALRYCVEATRRREPVSSGFIIWMGNEPFPNNANTSVIEYDGTPKPCYYWIRNAFSELHASARYEKLNYVCGEEFAANIYVTSDSKEERDGRVYAQILDIRGNVLSEAFWDIKTNDVVTSPGQIKWKTERCEDSVFMLKLKLQSGSYEDENTYLFTVDSKNPLEPIRKLPKCELDLRKMKADEWMVKNNSSKAAVNIFLYGKNPEDFLQVYPNYFTLLPNEERLLHISSKGALVENDSSIVMDA